MHGAARHYSAISHDWVGRGWFWSLLDIFYFCFPHTTTSSKMSKLQAGGHRKSQSTSALSTLASPSLSASDRTALRRPRVSQHPALGRVEESIASLHGIGSASLAGSPGLRGAESAQRTNNESRSKATSIADGMEEVKGWLNDVRLQYRIPPSCESRELILSSS